MSSDGFGCAGLRLAPRGLGVFLLKLIHCDLWRLHSRRCYILVSSFGFLLSVGFPFSVAVRHVYLAASSLEADVLVWAGLRCGQLYDLTTASSFCLWASAAIIIRYRE
jgi:hypothetical protein